MQAGTTEFELDEAELFAEGWFEVVDRAGLRHKLPGLTGFRLMEILRDCGLDVPATCGGACACGTCHVVIEPEWRAKLPAARSEEDEKLDDLLHIEPGSRLACQILWSEELTGLRLKLAPLEDDA